MKLVDLLHVFVTNFLVVWNIEVTLTATQGEDMLVQYLDLNVSMNNLFRQLNFTGPFDFAKLKLNRFSCATYGCASSGKSDNARLMASPCYCDQHCHSLGDCCHDYYSKCGRTESEDSYKKSIRCIKTSSAGFHGYVMVDNCPDHVTDANLIRSCSADNITDMMTMLPVTGSSDNLNYKNVFCAVCNQVHNYTYWQLWAVCRNGNAKNVPTETAQLIKYIKEKCIWAYKPKKGLIDRFQRCLAVDVRCTSTRVIKSTPVLRELCSFYALPVCGKTEAKNPHCGLCRGASAAEVTCKKAPATLSTKWMRSSTRGTSRSTSGITTGQPSTNTKRSTTEQFPLTTKKPASKNPYSTRKSTIITRPPYREPSTKPPFTLFPHTHWPPSYPPTRPPFTTPPPYYPPTRLPEFTRPPPYATSNIPGTQPTEVPTGNKITSLNILFDFSPTSHRVNVGTKKTVVKNKACQNSFIYDPFIRECRKVFDSDVITTTNVSLTNGVDNCSFIQINVSEGVVFPNGTLWVKSYMKAYNETLYWVNGSAIYICTNFSGNYTKKVNVTIWSRRDNLVGLSIVTYTGGSLSIVSLIFLLVTYARFPELRNLPGKNLLNLAVALILHHCCLFLIGQTAITKLCKTFAVLLHYFTLASFSWMSVLAFDLWKTFASKEINSRANNQSQRNRKLLLQYCSYAWGIPAVVVITCLILETTNTMYIGYGSKNHCWITNGQASLVAFGLPVALIVIFNIVALTWTVIAIYRVRKTTRDVTGRGNRSSVAVLYVKLTAVLGFTWLLCLTESFVGHVLMTYACTGLNSLQGFFICLVFVVNKRTLDLIKKGRNRPDIHGGHTGYSGNIATSKL